MDRLKEWIATGNEPPICHTMGFHLVEVEPGRVVFASVPGERHYNPMGGVHGGYAATLLDSACGIAVVTQLAPGESFTTLELKVSYLRGMTRDTGAVRAEGRVVQMGRRTAFAEAKLVDASERVLATATSTLLVIGA
jgi:uncharacterized protein (TIGR00369 family)